MHVRFTTYAYSSALHVHHVKCVNHPEATPVKEMWVGKLRYGIALCERCFQEAAKGR